MRFIRALWPIIFLVPLTWWADRGCTYAGVDPLYHATVWVHERLGWFVAGLVASSACVVLTKLTVARVRFRRLKAVAETAPARLLRSVEAASADIGIAVPHVLYIDLGAPIATTVFRRTIIVSRGFLEPLTDAEIELVARHEVVHVSRRDGAAGIAWHLAFAAMLVPGFEPLERKLHARRERAANLAAARGYEERYLALLARISRSAGMCADVRLGLEAALRRPEDVWLLWLAPLAVACLAIALPVSHAAFRHDLPYLLAHHC